MEGSSSSTPLASPAKNDQDSSQCVVLKKYYDYTGLEYGTIRFLYDGRRVQEKDTADKLHMEDNDVISVFSDQNGGGVMA
ncbi:Small ubiquitin- modifier 1 [Ancistrocladus abbreviatus]